MCDGGLMEVYFEPIRQSEEISLPESSHLQETAEDLAFLYGINIQWIPHEKKILTVSELMIQIAKHLAQKRERTAESLRQAYLFSNSAQEFDSTYFNKSVSILGSGSIVEALAKHFSILGWSIRAISSSENEIADFEPGECFIFAGNALLNAELLRSAVEAKPAYVGLIDSLQHGKKIIDQIDFKKDYQSNCPLFIPAGIDLGANNHYEVALSVVAEILQGIRERQ
jgi:xanthine/CO dehydrogenase XdhC/CoxF family maturation factor